MGCSPHSLLSYFSVFYDHAMEVLFCSTLSEYTKYEVNIQNVSTLTQNIDNCNWDPNVFSDFI